MKPKLGMFETVHLRVAPHLQRHVPCPDLQLAAGSLAELLDAAFAQAPALRAYVLDEQGAVRKHVAVFINGEMHTQRGDLSRLVAAGSKVDVIQALTGG
jgi:sulfur-carrier protein